MPTNTKKQNGNVKEKPDSNGANQPPSFIKYRLNDDELKQARAAADEFSDIGSVIENWISQGYKFSASRDNYGGGYQVFITPTSTDNLNWGYTLSSRAPTLEAAIAVQAWKHEILFMENWPKEQTTGDKPSWG